MNRKTFLATLLLGVCSLNAFAQDKPVKMRVAFKEDPSQSSPLTLEKEHYLTPSEITHKIVNGKYYVTLTVDGNSVTYPLGYGNAEGVDYLTHHSATPEISLTANEDPDHPGDYVTTFFSSLESYTLPTGVTAYTAIAEKNNDEDIAHLAVLAGEGQILPKNTAVLLHIVSTTGQAPLAFTMPVIKAPSSAGSTNIFSGKDIRTETPSGPQPYIFTYGHKKLGFYSKKDTNPLLANKAFIDPSKVPSGSSSSLAFSLAFPDEDQITGIDQLFRNEIAAPNGDIYSVGGMQFRKLQKGINIIGGKKVFIK